MADQNDDQSYGTAAADAPVPRADFERAVRQLNSNDMMIRDQLLHLAAQVVALTDELTRRLDGVEPAPAPPNTPAAAPGASVETTVAMSTPDALRNVRMADAHHDNGIAYGMNQDKYSAVPATPPCAELLPICHARCCKLRFALSTQDLDEGIIRWDYGRPYMIRQRESDERCVHNDPTTNFCTVHEVRPWICRTYHCKDDERIWADYENRILAPDQIGEHEPAEFDLMDRVRARSIALFNEMEAIRTTYPERAPSLGPKPKR